MAEKGQCRLVAVAAAVAQYQLLLFDLIAFDFVITNQKQAEEVAQLSL